MEVVVYRPDELFSQDSAKRRHGIFVAETLTEINFRLTRHILQDWNVLHVEVNVNVVDAVEAELLKAGWHVFRGWSFSASKREDGKATAFGTHNVPLHISALPFHENEAQEPKST